ncbi:lachesin-like [Brevipalpus obovatus]|uniref:lachesin-like n=1 Tax=Brevipalpus obovatus TaxID=246614 RepID=UPI003D9E7F58
MNVPCSSLLSSSSNFLKTFITTTNTVRWVTIHIIIFIFCITLHPSYSLILDSQSEMEPEFVSPIPNITVQVGRDAQLPCIISNLASFKTAWLRVEDKGILTIHENIITRNYRISLTHADNRNFILNIKNVHANDKGGYMCQINTSPMKSQVGYLDVVYPPQMVADNPSDYIFNEGENATIACKARGYPAPTVHWKREDKKEIPLHNSQGKKYIVHNVTGEVLNIARVTRVHMGAYLCIASNGIPNSVSRRFLLQVRFTPVIWIFKQIVGAVIGHDLTISCHIDSFPQSENYWMRKDGEIIKEYEDDESNYNLNGSPSDKYRITTEKKDLYKTQFSLTIRNVDHNDLGSYSCVAKNTVGSKEASLTVVESSDHHAGSASSSSSFSRKHQYVQISERSSQFGDQSGKYSPDSSVHAQGEGLKSNCPNIITDIIFDGPSCAIFLVLLTLFL